MKAAIYIRTAVRYPEEHEAITAQRELAERYCSQNRIPIKGIYLDNGISGNSLLDLRPAGAQLLDDAEAGKFDLLLVATADRLARDLFMLAAAVDRLAEIGVEIRSLAEPFDSMAAIAAAFAELADK